MVNLNILAMVRVRMAINPTPILYIIFFTIRPHPFTFPAMMYMLQGGSPPPNLAASGVMLFFGKTAKK